MIEGEKEGERGRRKERREGGLKAKEGKREGGA